MYAKLIKELKEMEGGVSSPMSTLSNTPGTGTAHPASTTATTGAQQTSDSAKGSGDKWDASTGKPHTQETNESKRPDFTSMEELKKYYEDKLKSLPSKISVPGGGDAYSSGSKEGKYNRKLDKRYQNIISDRDIAIRKFKKIRESNINPYDKIGMMMAKKMGVESPFKQKDYRTNTVVQNQWEELDEDQPDNTQSIDDYVGNPDKVMNTAKKRKLKVNEERYTIETLDNYIKASRHVPDHPLTLVKKQMLKEEDLRTEEATKDVKAKEALEQLGIAYEYKEAKSGKKRTFIKEPMKKVLETLKEGGWEEYGKNPENTIRKYLKGDKVLTIFADGKDLPRATLTPKDQEEAKEHIVVRKVVSGSINPYLKS